MKTIKHTDIVLIGGGIMSATLAILLHEKFPKKRITILERLPKVAEESSEAWNNAGTGHSGNCELNYTPENADGTIDDSKAIHIATEFRKSLAFWKDCEQKGYLQDLSKCLYPIPHMSFVEGQENVTFLEKRWKKLIQNPLFEGMEFSTDFPQLKQWIPLMMEGRKEDEILAATFYKEGYDVNFGEITDQFFHYFNSQENIEVLLENEVTDLTQTEHVNWLINIENQQTKKNWKLVTNYVFVGAGGGALPLLEKSDIKEAEGYGGFPISGQWLRCTNPEVINQHQAKVYGLAKVGSPPMSVPHLDTRMINGKRELLFGPFAGFSTKFLKNGSFFDLPLSVELDNVLPILGAGIHNITLTKYLIHQVSMKLEDKVETLKEFYPNVKQEDWELSIAGQRVQVIKKDEEAYGKLEFGTEIIISEDKTIAGLLGASPGASLSYSVMKDVFEKCF